MNELYLNWRQTDPRFNKAEAWPAQQFPDAEFRFFRDAGCLICALAVMLRHAGLEKEPDESLFNPRILNKRLIDCGAFTPAADLELSAIDRLYPIDYLGAVPYSEDALDQAEQNGLSCLITVPGKNADRHFLALLHLLSSDAIVYDPLCGEKTLSSYNQVCEIRMFRHILVWRRL